MLTNQTEIEALVKRGALFIISHSGGKDSQAQTCLIRQHVPAEQIVVVHADLGRVEWSGTKEHIKATIGDLPLYVVQPVNKKGEVKDLLAEVKRKAAVNAALGKNQAPWPSPSMRWCTSDFKRGPIQKMIRQVMKERGATLAVSCVGLRGDESDKRECGLDKASYKETGVATTLAKHEDLSVAGREVYEWLPIHTLTTEQVFQVIAEAGEKPHAAYTAGMSRLSCCFCIMAKNSDLKIAARLNPELYAEYVAVEKSTGYTMRQKESLEQVTGISVTPAAA